MKILFVGNSATYVNDMPLILKGLTDENGINAQIDSVTKGGGVLCDYLTEGNARYEKLTSLLGENSYDVLFLQEHGIHGIKNTDGFIESAGRYIPLVGAKRVILYVPCARKDGSPELTRHGWTNAEMVSLANAAYKRVSEIYSAEISSAATCFKKILEEIPDAPLYSEDLGHPAYVGSAVIALLHYKTLFGEAPQRTSSLNIDAELLSRLLPIIYE